MPKIVQITHANQLQPYTGSEIYQGFDVGSLSAHEVDYHVVLVDENNIPHGRCSLWWQAVPGYTDESLGIIGHFYSDSADTTACLLENACNVLRQADCSLAVGPMDGNTWRSYRFISDRGDETSFFLEVNNFDAWPKEFMANGFTEMASYSSALTEDLTIKDARLTDVYKKLDAQGITVRSLDMDKFEAELSRIYELSIASFQDNFLYTPVDRDSFLAMYVKVKAYVQADLTLLAEHEGKLVGYLFGIPDLLQKQRGEDIDTFIIKTVAVDPKYRGGGLGGLLVGEAQSRASAMGYKRAIHALMYDANKSLNISSHYAKIIRRYSLYCQRL